MNATVSFLVFGAAVPAILAALLVWGCRRFLPDDVACRGGQAIALAGAFFVAYALLPSWAAIVPERHWQWLPYLALAAMILGPVGLARGVTAFERQLVLLLLAFLAAWVLVPTWESLHPGRFVYVPALTGYLYALMATLTLLARPAEARQLGLFLSVAGITLAGVTAACVSVRYGELAGIAAFACAGCSAGAWLAGAGGSSIQGLVPVYSLLVGGSAFVAHVEPEPPLCGVLLIPLAACGPWICQWPPFSRLGGLAATALQWAIVLVLLGVGVFLSFNSV